MNSTKIFEISLSNIEMMFKKMQVQAKWNIQENMYWNYYFLDSDFEKLKRFGKKMEGMGLVMESLTNTDNNLFLLQLGEYVVHNPNSLYKKCKRIALLATEDNLAVFDGWDVEKAKLTGN